jgi:hypothetical protein
VSPDRGIDRRRGERRTAARPECNERRRPRAAFTADNRLVWVRAKTTDREVGQWNQHRCVSCQSDVLVWGRWSDGEESPIFCPDCLEKAKPAASDGYDEIGGSG